MYVPLKTSLFLQGADLVIQFEQYICPLLVLNFSNGQWSTVALDNSSDEQEISWLLLRCIWVMNVTTIWVFWRVLFHFFENFLSLCLCLRVWAFNSTGQIERRWYLGWQNSTLCTEPITCRTLRILQLSRLNGWGLFGEGAWRRG